jgi:hypothetical protein
MVLMVKFGVDLKREEFFIPAVERKGNTRIVADEESDFLGSSHLWFIVIQSHVNKLKVKLTANLP